MVAFILSILHFLLKIFIVYIKIGFIVNLIFGIIMIIALLCAHDYWYQFEEEMMESFRQVDAGFQSTTGMWVFLLVSLFGLYMYINSLVVLMKEENK